MAGTQTIPWKRISVEAAAIVVSILLAFAIDASWEDRQESSRRQELIRGLILDFESIIERSELASARAGEIVDRNRELLGLLASGGNPDLEKLQELLATFVRGPGRLQTSLPILDAALGAEGVGSIQDPGFLRALTNFHYQRDNYDRLLQVSADLYYLELGLFYRQKFGSIAALTGSNVDLGRLGYTFPQEYELTAEQIVAEFRKPELFGGLEHRYNTNRNVRQFIVNIRETAEAALQALRELD